MPLPKFQFSVLRFQFSVLLAFASPAFSQATFPSPTLTSISSLGGKPGSTVEITIKGADLEGPQFLLLNEHLIPLKSTKPNLFTLALPADLKPALYDCRFVGRYGVSNPRVFEISALDAVTSPGTNIKPDKAVKVALNSVIEGSFKSSSPHWFTLDLKKGQHLTATFDGRRFDTRTELMGMLTAPTGRELAHMRGGVLHFTAQADGTYRLRFNELMYRSGDDYGYRITLTSAAPPAVAVKPAAVRPIQIGQTIRDSFLPHGLAQTFDLAFKAGEKFIIEVHSHQLGHATDPHLVIENLSKDAEGKETLKAQAEVADAPAIIPAPTINLPSRDPSYAYEAKADGIFRITLSDNFQTTLPFELRVLKEAPKPAPLIALNAILPGAKTKGGEIGSSNVLRSGIAALEIIAPNRNALSDPIELKADKLPPGLTCLGGFIGKGQSLGYIAFQATADAPSGAVALTSIPQSRYVMFAVPDAARENILYRTAGSPALGVSTQAAPALVQTEKNDIYEVAADAKLEITLKVTRHADFTDALKLKVLGLIDPAKAPEADIPAKAAAGKLTLDMKALKLAPGDYGCILQGPAKMKYRRGLEELTSAEADAKKAAEAQTAAKKQLDTAKTDTTPGKDALIKTATEALKKADTAKAAADKLVKDLTAKAAPKEATFIVCSNPIRIRVKEVAKK
ncbi:hypothetical protein [Prosthecobacter vanneervenii]|uniref:Uncharacterized protein n=1 Tax=Prosthecobacter vanneervenii TaxID=48466 RepID=A0A7W7YD54_9BACT|nr:hypothetical protein [Prosthecobacter vanneervenii]MBB5033970.1 hypothetical protein [Prosthecobacter vanneervenii]